MKKILVDHLPLSTNINFSNDYISYFIYNAIGDPLFRYNKNGEIELQACDKIIHKNYKIFYIYIKDNLYYYNGEKVIPNDYLKTINRIREQKCYGKFLLENIKNISASENHIRICLKYKDYFFIDKLTYFSFSPINNKITSGPYYIQKNDENYILLKRNEHYRRKIKNEKLKLLKFIKSDENDDGIKKCISGQVNMTNNTTFPTHLIKKYNPYIYESNLIMCLKFNFSLLKIKNYRLRRKIKKSINNVNIVSKLNNAHYYINSFFIDDKNSSSFYNNVRPFSKQKNLTLGYTNYYPNKKIALLIKKDLKKINVDVKIIEYELCKSNECDFYLDIEFNPFHYNESLYLSKYFKIIHGKLYSYIVQLYERTKFKLLLNFIRLIVELSNKIIPILKFNNIYLCDKDLKKLNHNYLNYDKL